jgi:acyl-CoA oxidase
VEGDNWMITQQTASYLIKKMQDVVENPNNTSSDDTQRLYRQYIQEKGQRSPLPAVSSGIIDDASIVEAFKWRAAALVRLITHIMFLISLTINRHINAIMNAS